MGSYQRKCVMIRQDQISYRFENVTVRLFLLIDTFTYGYMALTKAAAFSLSVCHFKIPNKFVSFEISLPRK